MRASCFLRDRELSVSRKSVFRVGSKTVESMDRRRYGCDTAGDRCSDAVAQAGTKGPLLHLKDTPGPMDRVETGQGH